MKNVAVVPVKSLPEAKSRLSPHLGPGDRRRLVLAMLEDVLQALHRSAMFSEILIVSPDESLEDETVMNHGLLERQKGTGLNAAIRQASRKLLREGATSMMTVLADLPLAEARDFQELGRISQETPRVVLAPSLKGGTNVMLRSPPIAIPNLYGRWSYAKHLRAGQKKGIPVYSISNPRLSLDVDTIEDLQSLKRLDSSARTHAGMFARTVRPSTRRKAPRRNSTHS